MRLTDTENKLPVVTSEKRKGRGNTGMEEWEVQLLGVIQATRMHFTAQGIKSIFCNNWKWSNH